MAQLQKLETKVAMKSPEKIAAFFRDSFTSFPQLVPDVVKTAEVMGGGHKAAGPGSVLLLQYSYPGTPLMSVKLKWEEEDMEEAGEGKKSCLFTVIEGEMLEMYKSYSLKIEMDSDAGLSGWTNEYELANPNVAPPHDYLEACKLLAKACDKYC